MAPRPSWWHKLQASKQEALLAVDLYNRPGEDRRPEAFIVHMQIAWLYVIHAKFDRDDIDYWYRDDRGRRIKVEGDFKCWELAKCIKEIFPNQEHPVRRNVEFFIGFRNKIEHRYEKLLEPVIAGKAQSLIMNYEQLLVETFGVPEALADELRFPVFLSSLSENALAALKETHKKLPRRLTNYVQEYDDSLSEEVRDDMRYEFRVYLIPQTGSKTEADVAMRFIRLEDLSADERAQLEQMRTIVRDRQVPVSNAGKHKPSDVSRKVSEVLGVRFSPAWDHVKAWKHYKAHPETGATNPKRTRSQYCVYDEVHGDYVFTDASIQLLTTELRDPDAFKLVIGHPPVPLPDVQSDLLLERDAGADVSASSDVAA